MLFGLVLLISEESRVINVYVDVDGFSAVIAAGPFCTSDNILYEPLKDLMASLDGESPPDVCILVCTPDWPRYY